MRLATCDRCKSSPVMVNVATINGVIVGEYCGDCWARYRAMIGETAGIGCVCQGGRR